MPQVTGGTVFRDRVRPNWFGDGTKFWYRLTTAKDRHEFVVVDAKTGTRQAAFDHAQLAKALSDAGVPGVSAGRLSIEDLQFDEDGSTFTFFAAGKGWRYEKAVHQLTAMDSPPGGERSAESRLITAARSSRRTGGDTSLLFVNRSTNRVEIVWLDTEGGRRSYGKVEPGESREQHTFAGHVWAVVGQNNEELMIVEADEDGGTVVISGRSVPGEPLKKARGGSRSRSDGNSPDGKWRALVRDGNVYVVEVASGNEVALSRDGTEKDGFGGRIYWSPNSKRLVVLRTRAGDARKVTVVESSPKDQLQPRVISFDYLKPGDQIAISKPHLFSVESRREIEISDAFFPNPWSVSDIRWSKESDRFTFVYNQRGHQVLRIVAVDATSGEAFVIVDEKSPTFVDYNGKFFCEYLDNTGEILWMSERDGWNHLYLYDARSGGVKQQVTRGEWVVRGVEWVDQTNRQVWFRAGGIRPGQDPYYLHQARVNLDGTGLVVLTEGDGSHTVQYSPGRQFAIDTWSRVDLAPVTELRRTSDGALVCTLEAADISDLQRSGWRSPERFTAKGRDGETEIYGVLHFPRTLDRGRKYPVIENIYAGPHGASVPKTFARSHSADALAECGFIVVQIDGMGTSYRSKKFHDVCWKNIGDAGFPDRILWMRAAAEKHPFMDLSRVGIYGTSAGGQNAMRALLAHGDFYRAAVADSGCHDNRMDKIWWNELWMGWPVGPHYGEQSNVTQAGLLKGNLLLVAGELDRNVDPASTMQVVDALIKANRKFELLIVPGAGHGVLGSPYGQGRLREFFLRTLGQPAGYGT